MAFTLIELLVVITIIMLLAAMVVPLVKSAKAAARAVACANNLHHIGTAFNTRSPASAALVGRPYPHKDSWPGIPQDVFPNVAMYLCPEKPGGSTSDENVYELNATAADMLIPFAEGSNCRVINHSAYLEYRFEAGGQGDGGDFNDVVFHVPKEGPKIATFTPDPDGPPFRGLGTMSLCRRGEIVPGWEDFRNVEPGSTFLMTGVGLTNYGINALAEQINAGAGNKIIVLDYENIVANFGEDVARYLQESARHRGRLNVLFADGSVRPKGPTELDPLIYPDLWSASAR